MSKTPQNWIIAAIALACVVVMAPHGVLGGWVCVRAGPSEPDN